MASTVPTKSLARRRVSGFSLVEVMVAMLIGLIGTIVIFQTFAVSEAQRRTTTGGGDAQQNGLLALFALERDARMAGFGINYAALYGCNVVAYDAGPPIRNFNFTLAAAQIVDGAAGAPDSLTFVYGASDLLMAPAQLTLLNTAGVDTVFKVNNRFGFRVDDLIIAGQPGQNCALYLTTSLPTGVGLTDQVGYTSGNYVNSVGGTIPARWNKPGGIGVSFSAWDPSTQTGAHLFDFGSAPMVVSYSVSGGQLMMQNLLTDSAANGIVDGIVQLQAQYGRATIAANITSGTVDTWDNTAPVTSVDWANILAIRIGVLARSTLPERPNQTTHLCDTTATQPTWLGGTFVVNTDPNWQCYRYRTFQTVVPLRNLSWAPA